MALISLTNRTYNTIYTNKFLPPPGFWTWVSWHRKQMTYPLCYGAPLNQDLISFLSVSIWNWTRASTVLTWLILTQESRMKSVLWYTHMKVCLKAKLWPIEQKKIKQKHCHIQNINVFLLGIHWCHTKYSLKDFKVATNLLYYHVIR